LLGFSQRSIQIFTLINGSVIKTLSMPNVSFITSKNDVFFTSESAAGELAIYRIARKGLSGKAAQSEVSIMPEHIQVRWLSPPPPPCAPSPCCGCVYAFVPHDC